MLNKLGFESKLESDPDHLKDANSIILPGVGAFHFAMENLKCCPVETYTTIHHTIAFEH